ncbi:hypothetical protein CN425_27115 [Bacillus cereus]|uniref:Threonine transporter n=1 Tax=Bacillus cereus TaxID=1396 RepID=A0A2A8PNQ5_BACCE|nr:ABC-three component system middle component 2 [Bacillus cereus]PEA07846.1 hypothetical protein CON38_20285 [Bacillus cereus]PEV94950.1 hypothetical protein CN425_27115 [Bacillus cereus]
MNNSTEIVKDYPLFNSPIEVGLRTLVLLSHVTTEDFDINRLIIFDYFLLHAKDLDVEQENLHPSLPYRSTEIIIRRKLISEGLELLVSKGLINIIYNNDGIFYKSNEMTHLFVNLLGSSYFKRLNILSEWAITTYGEISTEELNNFINKNIQLWGGEFEFEALVRGNYE